MTFLFSSDRASINDELLSAYIDGEVTPAEKQRVEQALREQIDLRQKLAELQQTVTLMAELESLPVPRAFVLSEAQVLAAGGHVQGASRPSIWPRLLPRLMPLATAAVALALVVVLGLDFYAPAAPALLEKSAMPQTVAESPLAVTKEVEAVALAPEEDGSAVPRPTEAAAPLAEKREAPQPEALSAQALPQNGDEGGRAAVPTREQVSETAVTAETNVLPSEPITPQASPVPPPAPGPVSSPFRLLEGILGGLLVFFAALTVWTRRNS